MFVYSYVTSMLVSMGYVLAIYVSLGRRRVMSAWGEKVQKISQRLGRQVQPIITDNQRRRGRPLDFKPSSYMP